MDRSFSGKSLAILQLHKWDPNELQLDLSEFREAFLSPTRELLLLLSYQQQALIVPLITGDSIDIDVSKSCCDTSLRNSDSTALCFQELTSSSRSDLKDNIPCTSGSAMHIDNEFSFDCNFSKSNSFPFLCDVNSLAWGLYGDVYDQHKCGLFRELLFVSGNQGVMVHAFCHRDNNMAEVTTALEGGFGQGTWREWGPLSATPQNINVEKPISPSCEAPGNFIDKSGANICRGPPNKTTKRAGDDELSGTVSSKRWLQSFFTKAETIKSEGNVWTRLPNKSSFPSTAKVVSFGIFNGNIPLLYFPSQDCSLLKKESCGETIVDLENDSHKNSELSSLGVVTSHSYKCTRVFSSNSYQLIGFFLTLVDPKSVNISDNGEEKGRKNVITVARLNSFGIQWVFSVKLEERVDIGPLAEWTDFQFSDDFLVCLNSSGLISFYATDSGEYVAHLDILEASGLSHIWNCELNNSSPHADRQIEQIDEVHYRSTYKHDGFMGRRLFRRVLAASHASLLAVVDEYGVVYVISARDHVPDKYHAYEKLLPHYQHSGLGMLVGWEVGGSDVGCQRVYSNFLHSPKSDVSSKSKGNVRFFDDVGSTLLHNMQDLDLNGTGHTFHDNQMQSHLMRNVFLPTERFGQYDSVCFSPLGITWLIRRQNLKAQKSSQLVHLNLRTDSTIRDDRYLNSRIGMFPLQGKKEASMEQAVGCIFQGRFYLVTESGLSVILPSVSVSSHFVPVETIAYRQPSINISTERGKSSFELEEPKRPWSPWKLEILDRVLLYEGPGDADRLCLENGWDLKISRVRRLQMALNCLKFEEIKQSLEMLGGVNLVEEGILRLLLAAGYLMSNKNGNESEISAASRLLTLATWFTTKMIREYGLLQHKIDSIMEQGLDRTRGLPLPPALPDKLQNEIGNSIRLHELAHFLEIIRKLQCQLSPKVKKSAQGLVDQGEALSAMDPRSLQDEFQLSTPLLDSFESSNHHEPLFSDEKFALVPKNSLSSEKNMNSEDSSEASAIVPQGMVFGKKVLPLENPKEMIARWKIDKLDLKTVVKDALLSGRLPLAVLQLHLHRSREFVSDVESYDTFTEVSSIGKAIAYDLFLKGESGLATATLQKLGEDLEICLKELLFGTVRRPLRAQIVEEMSRYGYLGPYERKILERISLIERLYPSSSFSKTFLSRQKERMHVTSSLSSSGGGINLHLLDSHLFHDLVIHCGDIDGVVLGSWTNVNENLSDPVLDPDSASAGYWAAAAVWSNAWDQRTIDRIVLDQPYLMGVHVSWESQLEYHICHNNWEEVFKLLDVIPESVLSDGSLKIALDGSQPSSTVEYSSEFPDHAKYICSIEELDAASLDVPDIKIFRFSSYSSVCCAWLRMCIERELVKKFIFLKEYWEGTLEMVSLLACSGFITGKYKILMEDDSRPLDLNFSVSGERLHADTVQAFDKLLVHHCARYYLPNLLDLYLDRHKLVLDDDSLFSLLEAAGDCHWARWLLLSRMKGHEYDASFANACSILSHNVTHDSNLHVLEADEIICTIDDIAERGGEMAALATLMYAPSPIQNCLSSGSVNRHRSSAQCTLENLKSALQHFPTLWRTLESVCFGEETASGFMGPKANNALSAYLNWRDNIFFSAAHDTSLLQMLPCWFPKAVRRLIQLYVQGPLRWESLLGLPTVESLFRRDTEFYINADESEISAVSWEATIEKHVTEELYDSSIVETGLGLEHHLHRGCALAALNHLLLSRVEKLKLEGRCSSSAPGQKNVQSDVQTLLAPLTQSEWSMLSPVMPLAITHFEDSMLVASCTFFMELCGLSASMLRVDVAALRRISSFYKSSEINENFRPLSPKGSAFHAVCDEGSIMLSLACALADEYLHQDTASNSKVKGYPHSVANKQPSPAPMLVLQHLEKASIPMLVNGKTCGSWLLTGNGDGTELRSQQKAASQLWSLVTVFCQMHQLPLSTKYLAVLARDNDWVGFLSEAQIGGYPFDIVVQVASKEFSDPCLKTHILTVLKNMQSRRISGSSCHIDTTEKGNESTFKEENIYVPVELFGILADCEKKENPGDALLIKAKELSWSILAMIASCFPDASPLSCLTVWLEITAARETSSIKVNDIASQIADNVAAAVEATNSMPAGSRAVAFHYNRRNPKRKRLMEPIAANPWSGASDGSVAMFSGESVQAGEETNVKLGEEINISAGSIEGSTSLSKMVAVLCEQRLFLPLLKAFEMFLPSCSLLTFIRALQAFSQMRLPEASAHLGSFTARIKEEPGHLQTNVGSGHIGTSWISSMAIEAADAMLSTCPSPYEKRCLLQLLAGTDFGDGGSAATGYRQLYWKINLAEPSLRKSDNLDLGNETLDDASLLTALEKNRQWDQARNWTRQLEASGGPWKSTIHNVTEMQAESMVAEWKEFLWDVPEERIALWGHCQMLFIRYSFPALQAGLFFLKHAEAAEKNLPARELHELLLLSLQWLSGMITQSNLVYPLHLLREIETRVWLLAVESEAQINSEGDLSIISSRRDNIIENTSSIIDGTANLITKMDNHINAMKNRTNEKYDARENNQAHYRNQLFDSSSSTITTGGIKTKRRAKGYVQSRRPLTDTMDKGTDSEDSFYSYNSSYFKNDLRLQDEGFKIEVSFSKWEERIDPAELERAVLSLLEFGQIAAAKQLQQKLSPGKRPFEFRLVDTALKLAAISTPNSEVPVSMLDEELFSIIQSCNLLTDQHTFYPLQVLESLATIFAESSGRGLCKRIISVVKAANTLGLSFLEAFDKQPVELLRLLSLKAQESFEEAKLLVQTHLMPATSIAQILAESFLKGLLAAHRGGYMDSQKEEGPAPLLWRFSDFLKWAELCPSEPEIGHALMRLVITGQEIPHACEVELLILSHHFYKSSACLDGVDVLVALAATRVEAYVSEGDFPCLARLITGVGNFHTLNFILGILIENGQLDLLLQKYSTAADTKTYTTDADRGFRMAVLTSLKHFNASDLNAFAMIYNHFDMKHETAALLESQARQSCQQWFQRHDRYLNEDLLDAMRYFIEAAEVHSSIDAGNKTRQACAQASLVSLQIRMPDYKWLNLLETNARRALVEQSRFQEALIVAEAYGLNQPSEWALVLWNQMPNPELTEEFVDEFVAVLPLQQSMLAELAKFYKAEVTARGDQSQFSVWLTGGGLPADWAKHLGRSFRCLLKRTRDLRFRMHLATTATGFGDIVNACMKALDKYPDNAGPLVLRKGHGGTYLPVM